MNVKVSFNVNVSRTMMLSFILHSSAQSRDGVNLPVRVFIFWEAELVGTRRSSCAGERSLTFYFNTVLFLK